MRGKQYYCDGLNRGCWKAEEDKLLKKYIEANGVGRWTALPKKAGLMRCGKSCRLRWMNYLRPNLKRGHISADEEDLIIRLHKLLGNRWSLIAARVPGRTDNDVKNYWNIHLSKKLTLNRENEEMFHMEVEAALDEHYISRGDSNISSHKTLQPHKLKTPRDSIAVPPQVKQIEHVVLDEFNSSDSGKKRAPLMENDASTTDYNLKRKSMARSEKDELHKTARIQQNSDGIQISDIATTCNQYRRETIDNYLSSDSLWFDSLPWLDSEIFHYNYDFHC